ncbi:MAG: hypothetical protein IKI29_05425 [Clostridia bacterium]|nr:hypothetical protein [Clostridia bacterium]
MDNRPLSPWAYFGLQILYAIPIIGFIFLVIHSFSNNINQRNFARSYWCVYVLALIAVGVILASGAATYLWGFFRNLLFF